VTGRRRALGLLLALALAGAIRADAQGERPPWTGVAAAYVNAIDDLVFVLPIATVDRDWLHLEARYNYEDLGAVSGWVGYNLGWDGAVSFTLTPMLGIVLGSLDGIAPGAEWTLGWRRLELYSEVELVVPLDDGDPFAFTWSSLRWQASERLALGVSGQRLESTGTDRLVDVGPMVALQLGRLGIEGYWFNPVSDDAFIAVGATFSF
jgi:hypothetical protein